MAIEASTAAEFVLTSRSLPALRRAAAGCRGCPRFGSAVRVTRDRGRLIDSPLAPVAALTVHPAAILRLRDHDEREEAIAALVDDLRLIAGAGQHP